MWIHHVAMLYCRAMWLACVGQSLENWSMILPVTSQRMRVKLKYLGRALPPLNLTSDRTTSNSEYATICVVCNALVLMVCLLCNSFE